MTTYVRKRYSNKPMRRLSLVKQINKIIPEAEAAFREDFDGQDTGIWLRGSESTHTDKKGNVQRIFDYWAMEEERQYHPKHHLEPKARFKTAVKRAFFNSFRG